MNTIEMFPDYSPNLNFWKDRVWILFNRKSGYWRQWTGQPLFEGDNQNV